jgi:hypothetical protein
MKSHKIVIIMNLLLLSVSQLFSQQMIAPTSGAHIIDMALDARLGRAYVLEENTISQIDRTGMTSVFAFDPKNLANTLLSRRIGQAIAPHANGGCVVLWSGVDLENNLSTFITHWNSKTTVKLGMPIGVATRLAISDDGNIFVLGLIKGQQPQALVHCFLPSGEYVRSFHQPMSAKFIPANLGISRLVVVGSSVFLVVPSISNAVYEYSHGKLVKTYDCDRIFEGSQIFSMGPGEDNLSCIVQVGRGERFAVNANTVIGGRKVSVQDTAVANPELRLYEIINQQIMMLPNIPGPQGILLGCSHSEAVFRNAARAGTKVIDFVRLSSLTQKR